MARHAVLGHSVHVLDTLRRSGEQRCPSLPVVRNMAGKAGILSCIAVGSEPDALGHLVGSHGVATYGPAGKNIGFGVGFGRTAGKRNLASNLRHIVGVGLRRKSLMASHAY